mgnify:FL=1
MNDFKMNDFKLDDLTRKEVIDGVTIVHSGMTQFTYELNHERLPREKLEMYDANGNKFYSNFESIEEANQEIAKLAEEGITAVIGPKAPWRDYKTGNPIPNRSENAVGVFIVQVPEKSDDFSSHKTR